MSHDAPQTSIDGTSRSDGGDQVLPSWDSPPDRPVGSRRDPLVRTLIVMCVVLSVLVAFLGGVWAERNLSGGRGGPVDADRLNEVAELLDGEYYRGPTDDVSQDAFDASLEQGALVGLAAGAGDPYTSYLPPDDAAPLTEQLSGQYGGIGITVQQRDAHLIVTQVLPGGPAEAAGVRREDALVSVDGFALAGVSTAEAGARIRGEVGTMATLVISRPGDAAPRTIAVTRAQLDSPVVVYTFDPATNVAQIRVSGFTGVTTAQLDQALDQADTDGALGFVLDFRGNGGGSVTAAQEMIGRFVPTSRGPALYETVGRQGDSDQTSTLPIIGPPDGVVSELPLVVLVDGGTASAAEIVAASLADYGRATVMGTATYGKGSVQRVHTFDDQSILRVTIAEWITPKGQRLNGLGVTIQVRVQPGTSADGQDYQVLAASKYLQSGGASSPGFGW